MPIHLKAVSRPIINDKTCKYDKTTQHYFFILDAYALSFLWTIIKNKPMSLYDLQKTKFYFPQSRASSTIPFGNNEAYSKVAMIEHPEPQSYHYSFIKKIIKRLETKQLVTTAKDTSGDRIRNIVSPTFKGIIYFLQNESPFDDGLWKQILKSIENHKATLAFFLDSLVFFKNLIGPQALFWETMYDTIWEFYELRKVRFTINHLNMSFEGYLENQNRFLNKRLQYMDSNSHKNPQIEDCLEKEEATLYRNAYIAYLAMNDINILSEAKKETPIFYADLLISELELAEFEKREVGSKFLFDGERPKEFFPKYCDLQSFFVGMFIRNLLWGPMKEDSGLEVKNTRDYEIKELD
jgi:hypothetical protein